MEKETTVVQMTAEEAASYAAFKAEQERKAAEEKAKADREAYKRLVDDEIDKVTPLCTELSERIKSTKKAVYDNFKDILAMKADLFRTAKDDQKSHTFTNTDGNKRVTLGVYCVDDYRDTVDEGIAIVKECILSLASDERTKALVDMVMRLLAKDTKGTLKASRIVQLRKIAMESGDARFLEGVRIIEEAYQPSVSKQFVRVEVKDDKGEWKIVPLGMTEA